MDQALHAPEAFKAAVQAFLKALATTLKAQRQQPAPQGQTAPQDSNGEAAQDQAITNLAQESLHTFAEGEGEREIEVTETAPLPPMPRPSALHTWFDEEIPLSALLSADQIEEASPAPQPGLCRTRGRCPPPVACAVAGFAGQATIELGL